MLVIAFAEGLRNLEALEALVSSDLLVFQQSVSLQACKIECLLDLGALCKVLTGKAGC